MWRNNQCDQETSILGNKGLVLFIFLSIWFLRGWKGGRERKRQKDRKKRAREGKREIEFPHPRMALQMPTMGWSWSQEPELRIEVRRPDMGPRHPNWFHYCCGQCLLRGMILKLDQYKGDKHSFQAFLALKKAQSYLIWPWNFYGVYQQVVNTLQ